MSQMSAPTDTDPDAVAADPRTSLDPRVVAVERQLALVDRVIGLQAEVAELTVRYQLVQGNVEADALRAENAELRRRLDEVLSSRTWRLGIAAGRMLAPARRIAGRVRRGSSA